MLQRARRNWYSARLIFGLQQHTNWQIVHLAVAQRQNAGDATVYNTIAALVSTAKIFAQIIRKQATTLDDHF